MTLQLQLDTSVQIMSSGSRLDAFSNIDEILGGQLDLSCSRNG